MSDNKALLVSSMTGFSSVNVLLPLANIQAQEPTHHHQTNSQVSMSLKTLNARFFEVTCKLPPSLNYLETDLIKLFKKAFTRGTIYFNLYIHNSSAITRHIKPALSVIEQYADALKIIQEHIPIIGALTTDNLLQLPDIFETPEVPLNNTSIDLLRQAIEQLVNDVLQARSQEGERLATDLLNCIAHIEQYFQYIKPYSQEARQRRKTQLYQTLDAIPAQNTDEHNQARETQLYYIHNQLDKMDIHEELVRFQVHIDKVKEIIHNKESEKGKKIDFTLQELFREINTISAKSADARLSNIVIDIKAELEKAREQAQNIV